MTILTPASHDLLDDRTACEPKWRMTLGAQVESGGVRFRVWAPKRVRLDVVLEEDGRSFPLTKDEAGYFSALVPIAEAGMSYRYRLDNGEAYPDPCSRYQPQGPHGCSLIVNPSSYEW
ncbi:MAG TPA: hypothetical protein VFD86_10205, partial [Nitrospira sp.]|nr:hypothetical protein [Nitrospira sp.]